MILRRAKSHGDYKQIKQLYLRAFPKCEQKPFWLIRYKTHKKTADIWVIEEGDEFVGLAITMNGMDLTLLDYFAIEEAKRNGGSGSQALALLQDKYGDNRLFLEIERTDVDADNIEERKRRKNFYLRNNMKEMHVNATLFGVPMELLGYHCDVSFEEYQQLYIANLGKFAKKNVKP